MKKLLCKLNQIAYIVSTIFFFQLDKIHATVPNVFLHQFDRVLREGFTYVVDKLMVSANAMKYRTTPHRYKLSFISSTVCQHVEEPEIPFNHFTFVPFERICGSKAENVIVGNYFIQLFIPFYSGNG